MHMLDLQEVIAYQLEMYLNASATRVGWDCDLAIQFYDSEGVGGINVTQIALAVARLYAKEGVIHTGVRSDYRNGVLARARGNNE